MWWPRHRSYEQTSPPDPGERVRRMILEELSLRGHPIARSRLSKSEWLDVSLRVSQRILRESRQRGALS